MNIRTVVTATLVAVTGAGTSSASVVELVQPQYGQSMYIFSGSYHHTGGYFGVSEMSFYCLNCRTPKIGGEGSSGCTTWPVKALHVVSPNGKVSVSAYNGNRYMTMRIGGYDDYGEKDIDYNGYILCEKPDGYTGSEYPYYTVETMINGAVGTFGPMTFAGPANMVMQPLVSKYVNGPTSEWSQSGAGMTMQVVDALTLKTGESKPVIRHIRGEGHATLFVDTTGVPGLQCQIDGAAAAGGVDLGPGDSLVCRNASGRLGVTAGTLNVVAAIR